MDAGPELLAKDCRSRKRPWRKRAPVFKGHRDKRFGKSAGSILIRLDSKMVSSIRKPLVSSNLIY